MIFLTGMPLAGKTYWAKQLAVHYGLSYADLDEIIAEKSGHTIPVIFESLGEPAFRQLEQSALTDVIAANKLMIVACGGGTPVFQDNMERMKAAGCVIWLDISTERLVARFNKSNKSGRPLLSSENILLKLEDMLAHRKPIYRQAHYILDGDNLSIGSFDKIMDTCINRH